MKRMLFLLQFFCTYTLFSGVHIVTTTADSGAGSLRQAIIDANADGTTPRIIKFSIASGVQVITPVTVLPSLTASDIRIDGSTQPGWSANDPQIILDGPGTFAFDGLTIDADRCTIQDLVINNGFNAGISIINGANDAQIYGCFIGINQAGTAASGVASGISMSVLGADESSNTIIGAPDRGNILSGNGAGMFLGGNLTDTVIQGNIIGADKTGTAAIPNTQAGIALIIMPGSDLVTCRGTKIGGLEAGEGNIISGNGPGGVNPVPAIFMGFQQITNTVIQGNKIGVDSSGTAALPNDFGILSFIPPGQSATIDGTVIEGNVISANRADGILLQYPAHNSVVKGNFIGTDITGGALLLGNSNNGIGALSGNNNVIGGAADADKNIISGNGNTGIFLAQNTNDAVIQGNYIGTDITGTLGISNSNNGIEIQGDDIDASNGTIIGGSSVGEGNIIASNVNSGILFRSNVSNSIIRGNFIGTNSAGIINLGNGGDGILIDSQFVGSAASINNAIGGINDGDANSIKFNAAGVRIGGGGSGDPDILNPILGNSIFSNSANGIILFDGGNNLQESPVVTAALLCPTNNVLTITATAPANPVASMFRLEFFVNSVDNSPITEGELFVGAMDMVASGAAMTQSFAVPGTVAVGQWVSATATNFNNTGNTLGDTSEFSANFEIVQAVPPVVSLTATPNVLYAGDSTTLTATFSGSGPFSAVWSDGLVQPAVVSPLSRMVIPAITTNYSVTITGANGCSTAASALVTVYQVSPLVKALVEKYCIV